MSNDFVCFWKSIHAFKKHTSFVWIYNQLQIHTVLYVALCQGLPHCLRLCVDPCMQGPSCSKSQLKSKCLIAKFGSFLDHSEIGDKGQNVISSFVQHPISLIFAIYIVFLLSYLYQWCGFCCQSLCRNLWPQFVYIAVSLDWKINIHVWSCVIYWGHGFGGFVTFSHISSCLSYHIFSKMNTIIASLVSFEWEINAVCKDMKRNYRIDFAFKLQVLINMLIKTGGWGYGGGDYGGGGYQVNVFYSN